MITAMGHFDTDLSKLNSRHEHPEYEIIDMFGCIIETLFLQWWLN